MRPSFHLTFGLAVVCALAVAVACGGAQGGTGGGVSDAGSGSGGGSVDAGGTDSGTPDAGPTDGGSADAGTPDGGAPDAGGAGGGTDGGSDAGTDGGVAVVPPDLGPDWKFYATADGLPPGNVFGVSADEGGNVYVAGGTAGLLVQRGGSGPFTAYGIADGLHPYGYLNGDIAAALGKPNGSPSDPNPSLQSTPVISVAGGPAGTAFVGYQGKGRDIWDQDPDPARDCENEWDRIQTDHAAMDPSIYKSGDADKVSLAGNGISVVHYDIFSGPGVVAAEPAGREKLCKVWRIVYQHGTNLVWFGANHGFALGKADFAGNPTCNGQLSCAGVLEHVHPAFNDSTGRFVTQDYWGIAIDPLSQGGLHDVWFGGLARTTRYRYGETGGNYFTAETMTEDYSSRGNINDPANAAAKAAWQNRIDVWPDAVGEYDAAGNPTYPTPAQVNAGLDLVRGIATDPVDNSVYIASGQFGIRHLDRDGNFIEDFTTHSATKALFANNVSALAIDPDGSLWVGYRYVGGISRIQKNGGVQHYAAVLGSLTNSPVFDIQIVPGTPRRVMVAFQSGAVGIYQGN